MRFAVIIVTWNSARTIAECVASVRREAGADAKIYVVDNGSSDDSARIASRSAHVVEVIQNHCNVGFAAAVNIGLARTAADRVLVLNPDAILQAGSFAALNAAMSAPGASERVGAVGPSFYDEHGRPRGVGPEHVPTLLDLLLRGLFLPQAHSLLLARTCARRLERRNVGCLSGACLLVSREAIDEVGGMDERYFLFYEDVDWCDRIQRSGFALVFEPEARVVHKGHVSVLQAPFESLRHEVDSARRFLTTLPRSNSRRTVDFVCSLVSAFRLVLYAGLSPVPRVGRRYRALSRAYWRLLHYSISTFGSEAGPARGLDASGRV